MAFRDSALADMEERLRLLTASVEELASIVMDMHFQAHEDATEAPSTDARLNAFTTLGTRIRELRDSLERQANADAEDQK